MADNTKTRILKPTESPRPQNEQKQEKIDHNITINTVDALGIEGAFESGKVSEVLSENREQKSDNRTQGQKSQTTKTDPAAIKASLLKKAPTPQLMARQVEKEIKKEIKQLHSRMLKMLISPSKKNYYEMNNLVRKIRNLRNLLRSLLRISLESLRTLWLRFVHGVM